MSLELKPLKTPKFKGVKMECDVLIDNKLTKYPVIEDCFSRTNFTIIAGLMGQGKTTLALQMIRSLYRKCFSDMIVIIPEMSLHSIAEKDNIFLKHLDPEENIFHEYNADIMNTVYEKLQENSSDDNFTLLVIDDFGANLKDKDTEKILNKIIIKMRHLKCCVMLLCQNIYQLPKKIREVASNLITYNLGKSQMEKVFEDFMALKRNDFEAVMKLYENPHDYLLLNIRKQKLFFKFEAEVILPK
jgi:DNA replication protein DnaC